MLFRSLQSVSVESLVYRVRADGAEAKTDCDPVSARPGGELRVLGVHGFRRCSIAELRIGDVEVTLQLLLRRLAVIRAGDDIRLHEDRLADALRETKVTVASTTGEARPGPLSSAIETSY